MVEMQDLLIIIQYKILLYSMLRLLFTYSILKPSSCQELSFRLDIVHPKLIMVYVLSTFLSHLYPFIWDRSP